MEREYADDEYGIWIIYGEDPNCDLGGSHVSPRLGFVEGRYCDCLEYAKQLPNWFSWGRGGHLEKISSVKKIEGKQNAEKIKKLKKEIEDRQKELDKEMNLGKTNKS